MLPSAAATTSAILWGVGDVLAQRLGERRAVLDKERIASTSAFGACFMGPVGERRAGGCTPAAGTVRAGSLLTEVLEGPRWWCAPMVGSAGSGAGLGQVYPDAAW